MRLTISLGLVLLTASFGFTSACQLDYDLIAGQGGGLAGNGSDLGGGGPLPSVGGANAGGESGGTESGGAGVGGASTGGGSTGGTGTGGADTGGTSGGGSGGGSGGAGAVLTVTTASDEADTDATPASPGGTGFSLREAITYANEEAGHQQIVFQAQYTIDLTAPLPTITETAHVLGTVGMVSVTIDGSGAGPTGPCLSVNASDVVIESLWIFDCPTEPISFEFGSGSGNTMTNCYVSGSGPATFYGDGPVVLFNYWNNPDSMAIAVYATSAEILANQIVNPGAAGIFVDNDASSVFLLANVIIDANPGIDLRGFDDARLWHNTIAQSDGDGVTLQGTTGVDFRNNIVSGSASFGVDGSNAQFSFFDYNLYFDNASGDCSSCTLQANDLTADPLFVNPGGNDFAPQAASPAVDSGVDLGDDRNLDDPGSFNGTAPDRGFIETE